MSSRQAHLGCPVCEPRRLGRARRHVAESRLERGDDRRATELPTRQSARAQATQRALEGQTGALVRSLAEKLEPGGAVAGLLVEHSWALMLSESTTRLGGTQLLNQFVDAGEQSDAWPEPAGAAQARPAGSP